MSERTDRDEAIDTAIGALIDDDVRTFWVLTGKSDDSIDSQIYPQEEEVEGRPIHPPYMSFLAHQLQEIRQETGLSYEEIVNGAMMHVQRGEEE